MRKIATDIEQGERLMAVGIDPDTTADMCWTKTEDGYKLEVLQIPYHKNLFSHRNGITRPAWSLQALIGILPATIKEKTKYVHHVYAHELELRIWKGYIEYADGSLATTDMTFLANGSLINAAVDSIEKLKKEGYF